MAKRMRYLFVGVVGLAFAVLGYDQVSVILWVGFTDLTVEFVVTDAATGQPIEGAEIAIISADGFNADGGRLQETGHVGEKLELKTDKDGAACYVCRGCMCHGSASRLGLTDTYHVHLPCWSATARAPGYTATDPFILDRAHQRAVQHVGPRQDRLVVSVVLRKSQP